VTWADFLNDWNLWPKYFNTSERTGIMLLDSQNLTKVYTEVVPYIVSKGGCYEIDTDYSRSENKRYESLKKRGCEMIIKV
jgi:hypothetical protein